MKTNGSITRRNWVLRDGEVASPANVDIPTVASSNPAPVDGVALKCEM